MNPLKDRHPENRRHAHGPGLRIQRDPQYVRPAGDQHAERAEHLVYPLENRLGSKEPDVLLRIDPLSERVLGRFQGRRFRAGSAGQNAGSGLRENLCGKRRGTVPRRGPVRISGNRLKTPATAAIPAAADKRSRRQYATRQKTLAVNATTAELPDRSARNILFPILFFSNKKTIFVKTLFCIDRSVNVEADRTAFLI